tara:strand:+ start:95 stop:1192 length:1098 start_codon:yes stop_codon:yes gene_type:complete
MMSGIRPRQGRFAVVLRGVALATAVVGLLLDSSPTAAADKVPTATAQVQSRPRPVNFWIVSSRGCPLGAKVTDGVRFDYLRYDVEGQPSWGDEKTFHDSLVAGAPVCVSVHGSFVDWADVATDAHRTTQWLRNAAPGRPLNVVVFSWKSSGPFTMSHAPLVFSALPQVDAEVLGRRSAFIGLYLGRLVADLPAGHHVTLIGHSHGCRTVSSALHVLGGGQVQGYVLADRPRHKRRIRAILAAAAMDHHWLNPDQRYGRAMDVAETLINLRNHRDTVLRIYPLRHPLSNRALANVGFTPQDLFLMGARSKRVMEFDVSGVVGSNHGWPSYYARPEIARTVAEYVYYLPKPGTKTSAKEKAGGAKIR